MIFDLDQITIVCRMSQAQDGALINPGMPRDHAIGFSRTK